MDAKVNQNTAIFRALERAVKPLIRLMLARGITYVIFTDWLKRIYVDTALQDFSLPGKPCTDSRVSVITGVHRKDVKRLRENAFDEDANITPESVSLGSQLIATWLNSPKYMDNHAPKSIPRLKKQGGDVSFESLTELITKDVRARALLDELERLGAVAVDENDMVTLVTDAFIPAKGMEEKAFYLGLGVGDHANAAVHNVLGLSPAFYDRVLHYDHLPVASIEKIEALAKEQSSLLLQSINTETEKINQTHISSDKDTYRFSLGIYFYHNVKNKPDENH